MEYNAFNNLTERWAQTYEITPAPDFEATYENNRELTSTGTSDTYDLAGNVTVSTNSGVDVKNWQFDAAGRSVHWDEFGPWGSFQKKGGETEYDGDGRPVKRVELTDTYTNPEGWSGWSALNWYYIYSSVTGQKITDVVYDGSYSKTHVYMGDTVIAEQNVDGAEFMVNDPVTGSMWKTTSSGEMIDDEEEGARTEIAGMDTAVPPTDPEWPHPASPIQ